MQEEFPRPVTRTPGSPNHVERRRENTAVVSARRTFCKAWAKHLLIRGHFPADGAVHPGTQGAGQRDAVGLFCPPEPMFSSQLPSSLMLWSSKGFGFTDSSYHQGLFLLTDDTGQASQNFRKRVTVSANRTLERISASLTFPHID